MQRYSASRQKVPNFTCIQCGVQKPKRANVSGKYCSNVCQREYEWSHVTKPKIEAGLVGVCHSKASRGLIRYLTERDGYRCQECDIREWRGNPITLDVDHVDGDNTNNVPHNLRFLCPNCHRQTPTWGNKDRGSP